MPNVRGRRVRAGGAGLTGAGRARVRVPGTRGLRRVQGVRVARPVRVRLHLRHCRAAVLPPGVSARPRPGLATCTACTINSITITTNSKSCQWRRLHWGACIGLTLFLWPFFFFDSEPS